MYLGGLVTALATFVKFRLYFEAGSDPAHSSTAAQFVEDRLTPDSPAWGYYLQAIMDFKDYGGTWGGRERGMFGTHWINTTGGDLDTTWTTTDFTTVETAIATFWSAIAASVPSSVRLAEFRWYAFGPGVVPPNPPARIAAAALTVGSASSTTAMQLASTVTFRTALRRHWGRIYIPLSAATLTVNSQMTSANVDAWCNAAKTLATGPGSSAGLYPVIWDRNRRRAYGVTDLEVDSVPDIQRRRRPRSAGYKKILSS